MRYIANLTRSPGYAVAVDSFRDPSSVDCERKLVIGNDSVRTHSWGRKLTDFLFLRGRIEEDVVVGLDIQVSSPDSSVESTRLALLRLIEASISFLDRPFELLEELVSVPPIHSRPLPASFQKGEEKRTPALEQLNRIGAVAPMHMPCA